MKVAEAIVKFKFQIDQSSVEVVNQVVANVKNDAEKALSQIKMSIDRTGIDEVGRAIEDVRKKASKPLDVKTNIAGSGGGAGKPAAPVLGAESLKNVKGALDQLKGTAAKVFGVLGLGISIKQLASISSEYGDINKQIEKAFKKETDLSGIQEKILKAANDSEAYYGDMAEAVEGLYKSDKKVFPVDDAIQFSSTIQKFLKAVEASDGEIASVQSSFSKLFEDGKVNSPVLQKLFDQAPELADFMAQKLDVSKDKLLKMADAGKVSAKQIKDAIINSSAEIDAVYGKMSKTIPGTLIRIRNQFGFFIADINKTYKISERYNLVVSRWLEFLFKKVMDVLKTVRRGFDWLVKNVGGVENALKLLAIIAGTFVVAMNWEKLVSGAQAFIKMLAAIKIQTLLAFGAFILLALVVEDFIAFMQGRDSLLGDSIKASGGDVDEFRKRIEDGFTRVENIITRVQELFDRLAEIIGKVFNESDFKFDFIEDYAAKIEGLVQIMEDLLSVAESVLSTFEALSRGDIMGAVGAVINRAGNEGNLLGSVVDFSRTAMFGKGLGDMLKGANDEVNAGLDEMGKTIETKTGEAANSVETGMSPATTFLSSLGGKARVWGSDFLSGLIEGMESQLEPLNAMVNTVASAISAPIHFSHPDTGPLANFETWMPDMMGSLAKGIADNRDKVRDAIGAVSADMSVLGGAGRVNAGTALSASGSTSSRNVSMNVEINNEFNGDRAIQKEAAGAMDRSSRDITAELARGMAYAR